MYLADCWTGKAVYEPIEEERDALAVLSEILDATLKNAFARFARTLYIDDSATTNRDLIDATTVLSRRTHRGRLQRESGADTWARDNIEAPGFDCYTAANAAEWPLPPSEVRTAFGLAGADLQTLAARLNAELRREAARTLAQCAEFARDDTTTVWDDFRSQNGLHGATLPDVVDAITSGAAQWSPRCDWTPLGGALGDPFTVCRYAWGSLRYAVKLDAPELIERHLAGEADLTLYRGVLDYGGGPQEVIWPHQQFICCGRAHRLCDEARWPCRPESWLRRDTEMLTAATQCPDCGAISSGSWLTFRALESAEEPLAVVGRIDAVPPETLAATAHGRLGLRRGRPIV